jgi:hypothetical protein
LPTVHEENGTLAGPSTFFYAISPVDSSGGEGPLSFIAQANIASESPVNSVELHQISLPVQAVAFHVYRGPSPQKLFRIASSLPPSSSFIDTGLPAQPVLPPDPHFDHVNVQWRWEFVPETPAAIHSSDVIGNTTLNMVADRYKSAVVRITRGAGAGQERSVVTNAEQTLTVSPAFTTPPDATSFFVVSESSWRFGARGDSSPITITVPERLGAGIQITARASSVKGDEAAYALSPLTRWTVGQSGGLLADFDVPPAPTFGVTASSARGGGLDLGSIAFDDLTNTRGVVAGTFRFHYYDEVNGRAAIPLSESLSATGTTIELDPAPEVGSLLQLDREVIRVEEVTGTAVSLERAVHTTLPATHEAGTSIWLLEEKTVIVPFVKNFFGSPLSGDWQYTVELPNVRLASAQLVLTNAVGNGPAAVTAFTTTNDSGLRTLTGGQYTFQIGGYLAIQTNAAPVIIVDADRAVRDFYAILQTPPQGAGVTLQLNVNAQPWITLQFDPAGRRIEPVTGFGLPALRAGDLLSLDVTGVGTTVPGGDLTLVLRL